MSAGAASTGSVASVAITGPLPVTESSVPLSSAMFDGATEAALLRDAGYLEEEYLASGTANVWTYDERLSRVVEKADLPFTTRLLVRRPEDSARFSGGLYVEPIHPRYEATPVWDWLHPWLVSEGHAWVGVTQDARSAESMRTVFDAQRYSDVHIPEYGMGWEIVGKVAAALRSDLVEGPLADLDVTRAVLMGLSLTGSFCRVYLSGGFHEQIKRTEQLPVFDGYLILISSGGPQVHGYPKLSDTSATLPPNDPRRVVSPHGVPVFEVQSEYEAETNGPAVRPDSDTADDPYRLYQVAGTSHVTEGGPGAVSGASRRQLVDRGFKLGIRRPVEELSDGHFMYVARAIARLLDRWISSAVTPPRVDRFALLSVESDAPRGLNPGARPLARDSDGNVLGGIRAPWVAVPLETYSPHSSPSPATTSSVPWGTPMTAFGPDMVADMVAHTTPFSAERIRELYLGSADYLQKFDDAVKALVARGFLRPADGDILRSRATEKARRVDNAYRDLRVAGSAGG